MRRLRFDALDRPLSEHYDLPGSLPSERPRRLLWFDSMVMQTAHRTLAGVPPGPYGPEVEAGTTRIVPGPAGGIAWYDGLYTGRVVPIETARGGIVAAFDGGFGATTSLLSASQDLTLTNGKAQPYLGSEERYFPWVTHSTELQPEGGTSMAEGRYTADLTQDYIGDFLASQTAFQQEISAERARFEWIAIVVVGLPVAFLTPATLVGALLESTVQGAQVAYQVARNGITWSTAWDVALLAGGALMSGFGSVDDAASAVWKSRRRLTRGTLARRVRPPALNESELDFFMGGAAALRGAAGALGDLTGTLRVGTDDVARLAASGAPTILADFAEAARAAELARAARQVDGDLLRTFLGRPDDLLQTARTAAEDLVRTYQSVSPDLLQTARRLDPDDLLATVSAGRGIMPAAAAVADVAAMERTLLLGALPHLDTVVDDLRVTVRTVRSSPDPRTLVPGYLATTLRTDELRKVAQQQLSKHRDTILVPAR